MKTETKSESEAHYSIYSRVVHLLRQSMAPIRSESLISMLDFENITGQVLPSWDVFDTMQSSLFSVRAVCIFWVLPLKAGDWYRGLNLNLVLTKLGEDRED